MRITRWKLLGGLAVVLLLGAVLATSVFAEPPTPIPGTGPNGWFGPGMMGGRGMMGGMTGGMMGGMIGGQYGLESVANLFNMTTADLASQLQQGKTLAQLAKDKGVGEENLIEALLAPHKDRMQYMIQNGYMTQEFADAMLTQMTEVIRTSINAPYSGAPGYGCGGFGPGAGPGVTPGAAPGTSGSTIPGRGMMGRRGWSF